MSEKKEKLVNLWLDKAGKDLKSANRAIGFAEPVTETVCFHSQQSAEKYLKAYLIKSGKVPPRIHDIGALVKECSKNDSSFDSIKDYALKLSIYAVEVRYPDDFYEPTIEEAEEALSIAKKIRDFILGKLE